ncbi:MAG: hypothetical protein OFPI_15780 [Osedax symbiont Rs2]|nr:MAG: hypothetical protein OFPII_02810 [Osedax symbiont Rs1]EPJ51959.1 MAG: hypothetical protein OFPI_15780 [Osedax symbiont Rs2]
MMMKKYIIVFVGFILINTSTPAEKVDKILLLISIFKNS